MIMPNDNCPANQNETAPTYEIKQLCSEYENIAMHFNDLLIKLRTQAIGAVAAISTVVGLFTKNVTDIKTAWEVATITFLFLAMFWLAVWVLDFCYYNRLLIGTVGAILELERESHTATHSKKIDVSTKIEYAVKTGKCPGDISTVTLWAKLKQAKGRWLFYGIVFCTLLFGFGFSLYEFKK